MRPFFITAAGTDIGKTLVTTALCWQLKQAGKTVTALKPVISGYDPMDMASDVALILRSCGIQPAPAVIEAISPWRYAAALSPNMAAAREGHPVDRDKLLTFCREHAEIAGDVLLVEGVGGVMSPINDHYTVLDWVAGLQWPALLVSGSYLGAISHTLTAYAALNARGIQVSALMLSESEHSSVSLSDTAATLESFLPKTIPVVKIPRLKAGEELWKQLPAIGWVCD